MKKRTPPDHIDPAASVDEKLDEPSLRTIRLITLGSGGAGKTSLIVRYTDDTFNQNYSATLGKIAQIILSYIRCRFPNTQNYI